MRAVVIHGGGRKSGKTTVAEAIISGLKARGYTVASAKDVYVEGFSIDTPQKDTWRHREAGASVVAVRGPLETAFMHMERLTLAQVAEHVQADFLVAEGFSEAVTAKIACAQDLDQLADLVDELTIGVSGVVAAQATEYKGLPMIDPLRDADALVELVMQKAIPVLPDLAQCGQAGTSCRELAADVIAGRRGLDEICIPRHPLVTVDGKKVQMNRFVRSVFVDVIKAVLRNLHDAAEGDVEIHIPADKRKKR